MKVIFTLITLAITLSCSAQEWVMGEPEFQRMFLIYHTEDSGMNKDTVAQFTPDSIHFRKPVSGITVDCGYVTDTVSFSGLSATTDYVINHGLSFTPSQIHVQAMNLDAAEWCYVHSITATTFTISFVVNPTTGTNNILMGYVAYK